MRPYDLVKNDYYDECAKFGYDPCNTDWGRYQELMLPLVRARIEEERLSAKRQGVPDPIIDGKSDAEIIKERMSGKPKGPGEEIISPLSHEIRRNAALLNRAFPLEYYCGPVPMPSFNACVTRSLHGAVILVYDELPMFTYSIMKVFALSIPIAAHASHEDEDPTIVQPLLSRDNAASALATLVSNFLRSGRSGPPPFGGQGGPVADTSINLSLSTLRFIIAHECGHILAGHLSQPTATAPRSPLQRLMGEWLKEIGREQAAGIFSEEFTEEAACQIAGSWDQEKAADQYGMDLCLVPAWPMDGSPERLHDAAIRLAGPFIFFALEEFLTRALLHLMHGMTMEDLITDHPPSAQRAKVMQAWVRQISVNADLLLSPGMLFAEWLNGIAGEAYKHLAESQ